MRKTLLKGLAILLPAFITLTIFAWSWGVVRDYGVVAIIKALDTPKVFAAPESLTFQEDIKQEVERNPSPTGKFPFWETPDNLIYNLEAEKDQRNVYLIKGESYSLLAIGSCYLNEKREYNYSSQEVLSYSWFEYILAIVLTLLLISIIGIFARNYFGKYLVNTLDRFLKRLPLVNLVYPYAKQVVDFFFSEQKQLEFDSVVAVEWPRDSWQLGFVTGSGLKSLVERCKGPVITVFIPMSPLPMTGFTLFVSADQVVEVDMSVEEAFMIILSGGVLTPASELTKKQSGRIKEFEKRMAAARDEWTQMRHKNEEKESEQKDSDNSAS